MRKFYDRNLVQRNTYQQKEFGIYKQCIYKHFFEDQEYSSLAIKLQGRLVYSSPNRYFLRGVYYDKSCFDSRQSIFGVFRFSTLTALIVTLYLKNLKLLIYIFIPLFSQISPKAIDLFWIFGVRIINLDNYLFLGPSFAHQLGNVFILMVLSFIVRLIEHQLVVAIGSIRVFLEFLMLISSTNVHFQVILIKQFNSVRPFQCHVFFGQLLFCL